MGCSCCLFVRSFPFSFRRVKGVASQSENVCVVHVVKAGWRKDSAESKRRISRISNSANHTLNCLSQIRQIQLDRVLEWMN